MRECTVLNCAVVYYTIFQMKRSAAGQFYTLMYYTILYFLMLFYAMLCCAMLYHTVLYYVILYYTILYDTTLDCAILAARHGINRPPLLSRSTFEHHQQMCNTMQLNQASTAEVAGGACLPSYQPDWLHSLSGAR